MDYIYIRWIPRDSDRNTRPARSFARSNGDIAKEWSRSTILFIFSNAFGRVQVGICVYLLIHRLAESHKTYAEH